MGGSSPRSEKPPNPPSSPSAGIGKDEARRVTFPSRVHAEERRVFQVTRHRHKSDLVEELRERGRGDRNNHIVALRAQIRPSVVADAARAT